MNTFSASTPVRRNGRRRGRVVSQAPYGAMFFVALLFGAAGAIGFIAVLASLYIGG